MGGSYKQCDQCGKRALSIATRCPGCGREYPSPVEPEGRPALNLDLDRFVSPSAVAGVILVAIVLTAAELGQTSQPLDQPPSFSAADTAVGYSEAAYAMAAGALDSASAAATPAAGVGELLVSRSWTNVRKARSTRADLEAVLTPGDTVFADSLDRDWYRVALEGEVLGYAHRSTLVGSTRGPASN